MASARLKNSGVTVFPGLHFLVRNLTAMAPFAVGKLFEQGNRNGERGEDATDGLIPPSPTKAKKQLFQYPCPILSNNYDPLRMRYHTSITIQIITQI